ncbi:MAG: hypothetical protein ACRDYB_03155 [Acidimicrobiales bacterium]
MPVVDPSARLYCDILGCQDYLRTLGTRLAVVGDPRDEDHWLSWLARGELERRRDRAPAGDVAGTGPSQSPH